jgi:hypothetical protein
MKTEGNITTLTREELYDLVWAKPVVRLAKEFGISNVAVAKACRRHKIPLPGRGYWRQLETGKKVSRQPLPKDGGKLSPMVVFNAGLSTYLKPPPDEQLKDKIIVPDEPEELHVLARQALIRLTREPVDNHGLTIPIETLDIRVSEPQLSRAVRIMDTLIKRLELLGHNVEIRSHNTEAKYGKPSQIVYTTHVRIEEEALGFAI